MNSLAKIIKKIAGATVLYNPPKNLAGNIQSYLEYLDVLFVIDNSENPSQEIISQIKNLKNIVYIANHKNLGIAKALNQATELALEKNYQWLLTMDQDSKFRPEALPIMLNFISENKDNNLGIAAPVHQLKQKPEFKSMLEVEEVLTSFNSGSLLNLKAYNKAGGYDEDLFLDYVDHEYCLRLRASGYKIVRINKAILDHDLGKAKMHGIFLATNHNPQRRYSITKNRLVVMNKYKKLFPEFYRVSFRANIKEFIYIIFFEKQKWEKIKNFIKAFRDYKKYNAK